MKALLIDDHAVVRRGVRQLLLALDPEVEVREAADGPEGLRLCREARPDLVVLDFNLPGLGGLDLLNRLLREHAGLSILVLTMNGDAAYAHRALRAGARGFMSKSSDPDELETALRRVAAGGRYVEAEIAQRLALGDMEAGVESLSSRELDIVRLLTRGRTPGEAAAALGVSYKTVANSCTTIKGKLGATHMGDLVRRALDLGLA